MATKKVKMNVSSLGTFLRHCDVCKTERWEAVTFCNTCSEYLCTPCDKAHKGSKATRNHEIIMWTKQPPVPRRKTTPAGPDMHCDVHTTMVLNAFCQDHDEVICGNCQSISHKDCFTVTLQSEAKKADEAFSQTLKQLVSLKYQYEDLKETRQGDRGLLAKKVSKCLNDMRMIRHEINSVLDKLEMHVIAEVKEYEENISKEIADHVNVAEDMLVQIDNQIKTLKKCQKSRDDDVMFVGMKKTELKTREYEKVIADINNEINAIDIQFKAGEVVTNMTEDLQSIGTIIVPGKPYRHGQSSLANMSIVDIQTIDIDVRDVRGCAFMPDGHFVTACFTEGIKLFDEAFKNVDDLYIPAADVAAVSGTSVVVTQRNLRQLQFLELYPNITVDRKIKMDRICCGVAVHGDEIYVTCHDNPGNGEVQVLDVTGKLQRRLGFKNDRYMFTRPLGVKVSRDGTKVFVSDSDTNFVTCLDQQNRVIYRYSDTELNRPTGLFVDAADNVLVCGLKSNNVHVIRKDGRKQGIVLTEEDEVRGPLCVVYRQSNGVLVVGLDNRATTNNALVVVRTQ